MKQFRPKLIPLLLMMLLSLLLMSSTSSAAIKYVPQTWIAPTSGYFATEQEGRDLLSALRTYKQEREAYKESYEELHNEFKLFVEEVKTNEAELKEAMVKERTAWKKEVRKAQAPGIGVFAGPSYDATTGNFGISVGIGIVWKIW